MGNNHTKELNDCAGPEITNEEIKKLTYTGFTVEELKKMGEVDDEKSKVKRRTSKSLTSIKNIPKK